MATYNLSLRTLMNFTHTEISWGLQHVESIKLSPYFKWRTVASSSADTCQRWARGLKTDRGPQVRQGRPREGTSAAVSQFAVSSVSVFLPFSERQVCLESLPGHPISSS